MPPMVAAPAGDGALAFRAGPLLCALRLDEVIETMRPLSIHSLAGTPAFVSGVCIMRGVPAPVIDVARLLGGVPAEVSRFIAVRTERGPMAFATGLIHGVRPVSAESASRHEALLGDARARLVAAVGTIDAEPVLLVQSMRLVPDEVWIATGASTVAS
jgi:purine-binding chemotaxis protein CheW